MWPYKNIVKHLPVAACGVRMMRWSVQRCPSIHLPVKHIVAIMSALMVFTVDVKSSILKQVRTKPSSVRLPGL